MLVKEAKVYSQCYSKSRRYDPTSVRTFREMREERFSETAKLLRRHYALPTTWRGNLYGPPPLTSMQARCLLPRPEFEEDARMSLSGSPVIGSTIAVEFHIRGRHPSQPYARYQPYDHGFFSTFVVTFHPSIPNTETSTVFLHSSQNGNPAQPTRIQTLFLGRPRYQNDAHPRPFAESTVFSSTGVLETTKGCTASEEEKRSGFLTQVQKF